MVPRFTPLSAPLLHDRLKPASAVSRLPAVPTTALPVPERLMLSPVSPMLVRFSVLPARLSVPLRLAVPPVCVMVPNPAAVVVSPS